MNKVFLLFCFSFFIINSAFGQGGTWTWISGDSIQGSAGVFGTQGVPSINNYPPSLYEAAEWKDKQGNFWIYGGTFPSMSDLWKYNPVTNEWTWVKGDGGANESPAYGIQGVPSPSNTPGQRPHCAATWVDTSGAFWLFGSVLNGSDLWKYDISSNLWTWIKGDTTLYAQGVYGIQGIPSASNTPGSRAETCSAWTDSLNNLWLFGGSGLNDLWKYDVSLNEWTWMKGSAYGNAPFNYGTKGVADTSNDPGARWSYTKWKDLDGNFWIMGGCYNFDSDFFNDVWKYDLGVNEWTWMNGSNIPNDAGNYHSNCTFDAVNQPHSRYEQRSAVTDNCGMFWLFGGYTYPISFFNDLWVFDPKQLKWNWISGSDVVDQPGNYGTLGVASPYNMPPARWGAVAWWGSDNKFYLFGGTGVGGDLWVFDPDTNCLPLCAVAAGIIDFAPTNTITIYPNPTTDEILINGNWKSETGILTIYNILGETIFLDAINRKPETVNCKPFPSGIYFLQVTTDKERWVGRFVKE